MSTAVLLALVLGYLCIEPAVGVLPSLDAACPLYTACPLDTARPLVRFSPTRGTTDPLYANDGFGYSAAIHHTMANLSGLTLEEVLGQVRIIVGSPRGRFPGGFDDMFPDELQDVQVCNSAEFIFDVKSATSTPVYPGQIPAETRQCFSLSGLVYICRADDSSCVPFLGNGDANTEDGYLYKRNPNLQLNEFYFEYSSDALMGATMYSTGDYFVACAPRFTYRRPGVSYQPRGRCVFSGRDLQDFKFLDPCDVLGFAIGSANNQFGVGFCQSGSSVFITESNRIIVGVPGFSNSRGGLGYYSDLSGTGSIPTGYTLRTGIPAVSYPPDMYSNELFTYFGSAVVSGNFTGTEDVLTSSLRYRPAESSPGSINIITSFGDPGELQEDLVANVTTILGDQLGESFGKVMVAADLNGDGFDELVVTAPTYSMSQNPELGQVYIMRGLNETGNLTFEVVQTLTGRTKLGRFGYAATSLGDLNDDGLEDIAISAPYEGSGTIYIYYGSSSSNNTYINPIPHQIIRAEDMVDRVTELDSLETFGAFLQGNTDIDNNQYQDLLVGAEQSQALFVLRSRPMARISLTITTSVPSIVLSNANCMLESMAYPCFEVTVCGTYTGRGLTSFEAVYSLVEVKSPSAESRLRFEDDLASLTFTEAGVETCNTVTAYVTVVVSGTLGDLNMRAEMQQFALPTDQVDLNLQFTELSTQPVIESNPVQTSVAIVLDCSDDVCESDLDLQIRSVTYLNSTLNPISNGDQLTVGAVTRMRMVLTYSNLGEQALNFQMYLSLPQGFTLLSPETESGIVTCLETGDDMVDGNVLHVCRDFRVPLVQNEERDITLSWTVSDSLDGDEGNLSVSARIEVVNRTENIEPENLLGNNMIQYEFPVVAEAIYTIEVTYPPTLPNYVVSDLPPVVDGSSDLDSRVPITVTLTNSGPSSLPSVSLNIFLPLRNPTNTGEFYYLYPLDVNDAETGITCSLSDVREIENPSNLVLEGRRRKRQSLRENAPGVMNRVLRTIRQTTPQITLDCGAIPSLCARLECNATDISPRRSRTVLITTRIDNRFFYDKSEDYVLTTVVDVVEDPDSFVDTEGSTQSVSAPLTLSMQAIIPMSTGVPDWVIAVCVIAGIVFAVLVAFILGLLIFLHIRRRKRRGEAEIREEDEVETYNEKAFDNAADL